MLVFSFCSSLSPFKWVFVLFFMFGKVSSSSSNFPFHVPKTQCPWIWSYISTYIGFLFTFLCLSWKYVFFDCIVNGLLFKSYFTMFCKILFFLTIHYARQQDWKHNVKVQIITLWGFCNFHPNKHRMNLKCHQIKLLFKLNVCDKPWLCLFGYLKPSLLAFYG
jgi:hypothetical protein